MVIETTKDSESDSWTVMVDIDFAHSCFVNLIYSAILVSSVSLYLPLSFRFASSPMCFPVCLNAVRQGFNHRIMLPI